VCVYACACVCLCVCRWNEWDAIRVFGTLNAQKGRVLHSQGKVLYTHTQRSLRDTFVFVCVDIH